MMTKFLDGSAAALFHHLTAIDINFVRFSIPNPLPEYSSKIQMNSLVIVLILCVIKNYIDCEFWDLFFTIISCVFNFIT